MSKSHGYRGFAFLELVLLLVIVGLIGVVGYTIYNTKKENDRIANNIDGALEHTPVTSSEVKAAVPDKIDSASDLNQAEKALAAYDTSRLDDSDLSQLDSQLSAF